MGKKPEKTDEERMDEIIYSVVDVILAKLQARKADLIQAMKLCEDKLAFRVAVKAARSSELGGVDLSVGLSFSKEKVADKVRWSISDQDRLPFTPSDIRVRVLEEGRTYSATSATGMETDPDA